MGCRGGSKGCAMRARGDLLIDAKSKQSPPISSKHTVPHTTTHTPAGSSDMWTQTWEEEDGHVRRRTEATDIFSAGPSVLPFEIASVASGSVLPQTTLSWKWGGTVSLRLSSMTAPYLLTNHSFRELKKHDVPVKSSMRYHRAN
jgi:hypothetical protein